MNRKKQVKTKSKKKTPAKQIIPAQVPIKFLMQHLDNPISILDWKKRQFIYVNPSFVYFTGFTSNELNKQTENFLSLIHPQDFFIVINEVPKRLDEMCKRFIKNKKKQLNYSLNFRFKNKEDQYFHVNAHTTVLEWDKNNQRAVTLSLYSDINRYKTNTKIILNINIFDEGKKRWTTVHEEEFLREPEMLADRERDVMKLIVQGKTSMEISETLGIKFYTARSHWRNIMNKTGCKSQNELKDLAHLEGWI